MRSHALTFAVATLVAGVALPRGDGEDPAAKPPDVDAAIARAFTLLVDKQETLDAKSKDKNEWPYEGVYREGGEIPIGYRIGGTAICAWLLTESPQFAKSDAAHAAVERALDFVLDELGDKRMSAGFNGSYDVRGWGHTYALELMLRLRAKELVPKKLAKRVDGEIEELVKILQDTEIGETGGWNYSRGGGKKGSPASPFMTAPTLLALYEARAQGEKVDEAVVTRALDALEHCRTEAGAIPYTTAANGRDEWPGAIGRSPITEVTLLLAGRGDVANVRRALDNFLEHWEWLEKRRKQNGTHVPPYNIAPYYVFYAHGYAGLAIEFLPEAERASYRERLLARLFQVREESGGWNDRVFPRSENFGTAMGLMALLAPTLPKPAAWEQVAKDK